MNKFPHMLWSKSVLYGMLNALHQLSGTVWEEDTQEIRIGKMDRRVVLLDTPNDRDAILQEFVERIKHFIKTSFEWAPNTVLSHLQVR